MINVFTSGSGIIATSTQPYVPTTGMIRWNGQTQQCEVMDGLSWIPLQPSSTTISISPEIIEWIKRKQKEESELAELCAIHPGVAEAKDRLDIMIALSKIQQEEQKLC